MEKLSFGIQKRILKMAAAIGLAALPLLTTACSNSSDSSAAAAAAATSATLTVTQSETAAAYGDSVLFTASGGSGSYTYSVTSGTGTIDATSGEFVAPQLDETDTIEVVDTSGNYGTASITISASGSSSSTTTIVSTVVATAASGNFTKINTSWETLATFHGSCTNSSVLISDFCFAAVHRFCASEGYATGFGPTEYDDSSDTVQVNCVSAAAANIQQNSFTTLSGYQPSCTALTVASDGCMSAVNRFCVAQGNASGFAVIEHGGDSATVGCIAAGQATVLSNMSFASNLVPYVASCSSSQVESGFCNAAVDRYCESNGYFSGFGVIEHGGDSASFACVK